MSQFTLRDFTKHASFFLRDRLNDARLALTDVSRVQLLAEEATNEDPWGPEPKTMASLAEAAFELEEYERIMEVVRSRLRGSKQRSSRQLHKTLTLVEYLLIRGPASIAKEFREDIYLFEELSESEFVDAQGIDRGSMVHKIVNRVLDLLKDPALLNEERFQARKLSSGIRGFGNNFNEVSFKDRTQNEEDKIERAVLPLPRKMPANEASTTEMHGVLNDRFSMEPNQVRPSTNFVYSVEEKVSPHSYRKSVSSLGYLKERLPYLGRQAFPDEGGKNDEEVSVSLLDEGVDAKGFFQQVAQVTATERACQLISC